MYAMIDIGGTNTRIGFTEDLKNVDQNTIKYCETPDSYDSGIELIFNLISETHQNTQFKGISIGIAGTLNKSNSFLVKSPNLSAWENQNIKEDFQKRFNCPVLIENDTAIVGLGEVYFGNENINDTQKICCYITVSTGVGGVRITNGKIDKSNFGFEPGHQIIDIENDNFITLEEKVSGSGFRRWKNEQKNGVAESENMDENIFWKDAEKYLAVGLRNIILHWSPEKIILGGGVIINNQIDLEKSFEILKDINHFPNIPEIQLAKLDSFGGLYGGMAMMSNLANS